MFMNEPLKNLSKDYLKIKLLENSLLKILKIFIAGTAYFWIYPYFEKNELLNPGIIIRIRNILPNSGVFQQYE